MPDSKRKCALLDHDRATIGLPGGGGGGGAATAIGGGHRDAETQSQLAGRVASPNVKSGHGVVSRAARVNVDI